MSDADGMCRFNDLGVSNPGHTDGAKRIEGVFIF